jgi:predicted O-methyltransferase YrrM
VKPCNAATYRAATLKLAQSVNPKIVVEVGVYAGALSAMLATIPSIEKQFIVDSWEGGYSGFDQKHMDGIAAGVIAWSAAQPKVMVHRMRSIEGAKGFADESIDFFHTDGDHSLEGITSDIRAWLPKVKKGAVLSGDNYEIPAVAAGVKKLLPQHKLLANGRLWWAVK